MKWFTAFTSFLFGEPITLPAGLAARFPELSDARWRRGGLALRIGGWCLGSASVTGITLWRTVFLHRHAALDPEFLLHEVRHVHQFQGDRTFPLRYLWGTLRHGYSNNPYEADARAFAARRLTGATPTV
jgi:hypothetical protein